MAEERWNWFYGGKAPPEESVLKALTPCNKIHECSDEQTWVFFYKQKNKEGAVIMEEMNVQERRQKDSWEEIFPREAEDALIQNVMEMEENSEWIPGITARDIHLEAIDDRPIFLDSQMQQYHLDNTGLVEDTALAGTRLLIYTGARAYQNGRRYELVRDTAVGGLHRVARLNGNSLGQMTREKYCETMNNGFETAKGTALGLIRYGKLSGLQDRKSVV